jgi:hypothetical protein
MGGLGILDLTKFNRALRLQWTWYKWNNRSKPWSDMHVDMNSMEAALFETCTTLVLRDGKSTSLWVLGFCSRCSSPTGITRVEIGVEPRPKP